MFSLCRKGKTKAGKFNEISIFTNEVKYGHLILHFSSELSRFIAPKPYQNSGQSLILYKLFK
jgi:hypothetical protein